MAQRRSLSGRSPFCQLQLSEKSQIHWKGFFHESNKFEKTQRNKTTNHNAVSRRVQGRVGEACSSGGYFFCAHAVRAQSSDGHKNVLSLIGYSHMLENR